MKNPFKQVMSLSFSVLSLMFITTSKAHAQIGYDLLPASFKATLETVIPAVHWRNVSPNDALNDIIGKLNSAVPAERKLQIAPLQFKARADGSSGPLYAEPMFPLIYPENTVSFSGRKCKARDLIRFVCDTTGLSVSTFGEQTILFTQVDSNSAVDTFTERIVIPPTLSRNLARWTDYSWLKSTPWKTRFLLQASLPLHAIAEWSNRDTILTVTANAFPIWRIQSLARSVPLAESAAQLSDAEKRLGRALLLLSDIPAKVALPDSNQPIDKFVEQTEQIFRENGLKLKIRIPSTLTGINPEPVLGTKEIIPDQIGFVEEDEEAGFLKRFWKALSDYGLQIRASDDGELIIVPRSVGDNLDYVMTTEISVSKNFLEKIPNPKPTTEQQNPPGAIIEPAIRFPRDWLVIFSKSSSSVTIRAPRWRHLPLLMFIDQIEKSKVPQKSKTKK